MLNIANRWDVYCIIFKFRLHTANRLCGKVWAVMAQHAACTRHSRQTSLEVERSLGRRSKWPKNDGEHKTWPCDSAADLTGPPQLRRDAPESAPPHAEVSSAPEHYAALAAPAARASCAARSAAAPTRPLLILHSSSERADSTQAVPAAISRPAAAAASVSHILSLLSCSSFPPSTPFPSPPLPLIPSLSFILPPSPSLWGPSLPPSRIRRLVRSFALPPPSLPRSLPRSFAPRLRPLNPPLSLQVICL